MQYKPAIGLEVHIQLGLASKLFAGDATIANAPNVAVSPLTLAHPGTLPVVNSKAFELAIKLAIALNSKITSINYFDRKHYFYPDLPKGYQITQHRTPVGTGGFLPVSVNEKTVNVAVHHFHLEEDAGKSMHETDDDNSYIDLNRAGIALIELVTEPVITSPEIAGAFLASVRKLIRHLEIGDGNMENGNLRCDANISIAPFNSDTLGTKTEVKNVNSIRFLQQAIKFELKRQQEVLERGDLVMQETRSYDSKRNITVSMRDKEQAHDYRYMPDPDIPPYIISESAIESALEEAGTLPWNLIDAYMGMGLSFTEADAITDDRHVMCYFEGLLKAGVNPRIAFNWVMGPLRTLSDEQGKNLSTLNILPETIAEVITLVDEGVISYSVATGMLLQLLHTKGACNVRLVAEENNLLIKTDNDELDSIIEQVISECADEVIIYKKGKKALFGFFMGEVNKKTKGLYNAGEIRKKLTDVLNR